MNADEEKAAAAQLPNEIEEAISNEVIPSSTTPATDAENDEKKDCLVVPPPDLERQSTRPGAFAHQPPQRSLIDDDSEVPEPPAPLNRTASSHEVSTLTYAATMVSNPAQHVFQATLVEDPEEPIFAEVVPQSRRPSIQLKQSKSRYVYFAILVFGLVGLVVGLTFALRDDTAVQPTDANGEMAPSGDDEDDEGTNTVEDALFEDFDFVSVHSAVVGSLTTCDIPPEDMEVELSCPEAIQILESTGFTCTRITLNEKRCQITSQQVNFENFTRQEAHVIFACGSNDDTDAGHIPQTLLPLSSSNECVNLLDLNENRALYGGGALQYMSVGRFCRVRAAPRLITRNPCQPDTRSAVTGDRQIGTDQRYCYAYKGCARAVLCAEGPCEDKRDYEPQACAVPLPEVVSLGYKSSLDDEACMWDRTQETIPSSDFLSAIMNAKLNERQDLLVAELRAEVDGIQHTVGSNGDRLEGGGG